MPDILILGTNGQLARNTIPFFLKHPDVRLTLYLHRANRLQNPDPSRVTIVEGDVLDLETLKAAMQGQDAVYANLAGTMEQQTRTIAEAMHATGLKRLIFISSMGIYGEVPGEGYRSVLDPYRDSAAVIESSDLDYTILRPGWFARDDEVNYQIMQRAVANEIIIAYPHEQASFSLSLLTVVGPILLLGAQSWYLSVVLQIRPKFHLIGGAALLLVGTATLFVPAYIVLLLMSVSLATLATLDLQGCL